MTTTSALSIAILAGLAGGFVYCQMMGFAVRGYLPGTAASRQVTLLAARLALVGALFWLAAQFGAIVLLVVLASFITIRLIALRNFVVGK